MSMDNNSTTTTNTTTTGMGEISFPDQDTVYLKPALLIKQAQWRKNHIVWSCVFPISSSLLWCYSLALLLHPVGVILLRKYRADFQPEWQALVVEMAVDKVSIQHQMIRMALGILDGLAAWVLDASPRMAAVGLYLHLTICLGYLSYTLVTSSGTTKSTANQSSVGKAKDKTE